MTSDPFERLAVRASRPLGIGLLALVVVWILLVVRAPEDAVQGVVQKILYVHVPTIFSAYLGFLVTAEAAKHLPLQEGRAGEVRGKRPRPLQGDQRLFVGSQGCPAVADQVVHLRHVRHRLDEGLQPLQRARAVALARLQWRQ